MAYFRILKIYSPDLSPIENIWAILKKPVKDQLNERQVKRKDQHWKLCKEFWNQIPLSTFQKAIESMPKRWDSVIKNCGGNINKLFIKQVNQQEPFVPHCTSNLNLLICILIITRIQMIIFQILIKTRFCLWSDFFFEIFELDYWVECVTYTSSHNKITKSIGNMIFRSWKKCDTHNTLLLTLQYIQFSKIKTTRFFYIFSFFSSLAFKFSIECIRSNINSINSTGIQHHTAYIFSMYNSNPI